MNSYERYWLLVFIVLGVYFGVSKFIFDNIYDTTQLVIDELFHISQGKEYCAGNYTHWDPKITTLPGLYFVSAFTVGVYFECTTYILRFVNLIASCINYLLFADILRFVYFLEKKQIKNVIQALSLTILPPLYFFSHVYYTDTLSLTFLLIFSRLCFTYKYKCPILLFGFLSIFMRQTNVVWIAMVFGHKVLDLLIKSSRVFGNKYITNLELSRTSLIARDIDSSKLKRYYNLMDVYCAVKYHLSTFLVTFLKFLSLQDWLVLMTHCIVLSFFVSFIYVNGSIVLGDKAAHEATIHIPQLLYFLIFYGVFGLPYVLAKLPSTVKLILSNKLNAVIIGLLMALIVHFNTLVHPYLLADNRHFTFYIWNRWFGKYDFAIYATIPVYIFLLFSLYDNLRNQNCISFLLPYCISLFLALGLQRMIEVRYFLIPYIILRLRFVRPPMALVMFEFLYYVAINVAVFYVFFNRKVYWHDFDYPQRIIW